MEEIDFIYKQIRKETPDYDKQLENGNIYCANILTSSKKITPNEFIYLSAYYSYYKSIKKADEFIKKMINKTTLSKIKRHLADLGYINIKKENMDDLKKKTIKLSHKGNECEWCGKECYILQEHHYPIPAKDGGTQVVSICPNCHYTFHKLESEKYE